MTYNKIYMDKLSDIDFVKNQFSIFMKKNQKCCFAPSTQERLQNFFFMKNKLPLFNNLRNNEAIFFYGCIADYYEYMIDKNKYKMGKKRVYSFTANGKYNKEQVLNIYKLMLNYYNNIIIKAINECGCGYYKDTEFKPLPDNTHLI